MRESIKKILSEEFDWIQEIPSTPDGVTIGPPESQSNPKNTYRVIMTHGYGEDYATWSRDWRHVDTQNPNALVWYIKLLSMVQEEREVWDAMSSLAEDMMEGRNRWVLEKVPYGNWTPRDWDDEDDLRDTLSDLFYDIGLRQYDSYHQADASFEDWSVVYFDGYGIPHKVEVDRRRVLQTEL
jgi:hypothetical protein